MLTSTDSPQEAEVRTSPTKLLYLATAVAAVVMLLAGVSLWTVLTVAFVAYMVGMHLGGHAGHGGRGGASGGHGGASGGHAGHDVQADRPRDGVAQRHE
jgi:hypothetical protein